MKVIVEVLVDKYRKGSIIKNIDNDDVTFYLPEKKESFKSYNYDSKMKSLKKSSFEYLGHTSDEILKPILSTLGYKQGENDENEEGDHFYLCREEIVLFKIMNTIHLGSSDHLIDDSLVHDVPFPCESVMDDIESDIEGNDRKGHLTKVVTCLFQEDWHQCYEGDWDGNSFYIGVLNENGHLYPSSKKRLSKEKEQNWPQWDEQ